MNSPWNRPDVARLFQDHWNSNASFSASAMERLRSNDSSPGGRCPESTLEFHLVENFFDRNIYIDHYENEDDTLDVDVHPMFDPSTS
jgi:hypothetical protein